MNNNRYFYAPALFSSVAKLFVLTEDGRLFTSNQDRISKIFLLESDIDFLKFQAWDINVENSPLLLEVTRQVVENFIGSDYPDWWSTLLENEELSMHYIAEAG